MLRITNKTKNAMKTLWMKTIVLLLLGATAHAQEREQVPGDNFSLEGALELFKKSASPEEFERLLNLPESEVNNLDLNGDGNIDYVRVINRNEGNIHTFTLQAVISRNEFQDIAVISLEKLENGRAILQITGDADVYGIETIIEPTTEVRINAGTTTTHTFINVWDWPFVQYVYSPFYSPWVSPWYWDYWPMWWRPWRPVAFINYYPRWNVYRPYYRYCDAPRIRYASRIYYPHRATSIIVYNRHRDQISTYRSTRNVYGETRGRDDRDSRTMRYENRNRSVTNRSSRELDREDGRERTTNPWRNSDTRTSESTGRSGNSRSNENRTQTTERNTSGSERNSSNRSFGERSSSQSSNRTFEQPRESRSSQSSGGSRPEVRQESRSSQPSVRPSEPRQSSGGQTQRSGSGSSSSGSGSGKRGRD
jgi:hypothetical protein